MKRSQVKPRTKRIPAVNRKRKAKKFVRNFHSKEYVEHIRSLPCARCGIVGLSVAAHTVARGMGGANGKASDLVPLCTMNYGCHYRYDHHLITAVERAVLKRRAAELWSEWQATQEEPR